MTKEELIDLLESTANLLRGMSFDRSIPGHVKTCLEERVSKIDRATKQAIFQLMALLALIIFTISFPVLIFLAAVFTAIEDAE